MDVPVTDTPTESRPSSAAPSWAQSMRVYLEPASVRMLFLGFSSGLPLLLVLGTLAFRLREAGIDRTTIGHMSWVGLMYGFKWVWSPLVDRMPIPLFTRWLGRRRSWLLLAQCGLVAGLVAMALVDPRQGLEPLTWAALLVAFCSATQDIALDAYRIESASSDRQAALAATYQTGYRLAMLWAGAGVLWLAAGAESQGAAAIYQNGAWRFAYLTMAASMLVGMVTVLLAPEPDPRPLPPARNAREWLRGALIDPFMDFFERYKWHALLILALIGLYRISDIVLGIMANPFYVDMHYTKTQVALVTKVWGVIFTLAGTFIGGVLAVRLGVMRVLMLGTTLSAGTHLLFAWLSTFIQVQGDWWPVTVAGHAFMLHKMVALTLVIIADNLASGITSAAFIAFLSGLTSVSYSATQYALFSSLMLLLPKYVAGYGGAFVDHFGYTTFFLCASLLVVPVLALVWVAGRVLGVQGQVPRPA